MNQTATFKCPSCGGYLEYDPAGQRFLCPYCGASFNEEELREQSEAKEQEAQEARSTQSGSLKSETDGYLKKNTLHSGERLAGFVNIGYSKGCYMLMRIPVGGRDFVFRWKL